MTPAPPLPVIAIEMLFPILSLCFGMCLISILPGILRVALILREHI
jgi:hypothetical protein